MRRFVLALCVLIACDDDDSSGPLTADGLGGAFANAYCSALVRCGAISDVGTCRAIIPLDFEADAELQAAVDNGTVLFHEDEARLCLAGLGATCEEDRLFDENAHCDLIFSGTVDAGGGCAIDAQCLSGFCSTTSCPDACCPGTCSGSAPPPRPGIGESCANFSQCLDGFCDPNTMLCTAFLATGSSCTASSQCQRGYCAGTCTTLPGEGQPCVPNQGDGESCDSIGLYCHPTTAVCTPYSLQGDSCGDGAACSPIYMCTGSVCELRPRLGDSCTPQTSLDCIDSSYCDPATQRCTAPKPDGASCDSSQECIGDCDFSTMTCMSDPICI